MASRTRRIQPQRFGRYILLDKVASGGMAEVWRGKQEGAGQFQRLVAIKKILSHISEDPEFRSMFADEANITVALQHPNIGQVQEFNHINNTYYIAMEYISGKDLKSLWKSLSQKNQLIPVPLACLMVQKIAEGLDYAHNKVDNMGNPLGIVHRDVSPQNVLISWEGEVKVIDFGIAKANEKESSTKVGTLKGKFAYMSPEQIRGLPLDGRADIFAIGVVLYELLTGTRAFTAESEFSLLEKVRQVELKPPTMINADIPPELERIVFKALEKDRKNRYQRARDLAEDLQRYLLAQGRPPGAPEIGQFLREGFTVDYDKERLRLMRFESLTLPPADQLPSLIRTEADVGAGSDTESGVMPLQAIRTMLANEHAIDGSQPENTFASGAEFTAQRSAEGTRPSAEDAVSRAMRMDANSPPVAGIRPATSLPTPSAPSPKGSAWKWVALTFLFLGLAGGAAGFAYVNGLFGGGSVLVTVKGPAKATVFLDGEDKGAAQPSLTLKVRPGKHTLVVEAPSYNPYVDEVTIEAGSLFRFEADMKRVSGQLRVTSIPDGVAIMLDGKKSEFKTPHTFNDFEKGTIHNVTLAAKGYARASKDVTIGAEEDTKINFVLEPTEIVLHVRSTPLGAKVFLGGEEKGETPFDLVVAKENGAPSLEFKRKRCKNSKMQVVFSGKKEETLNSILSCY